MSDDVIKRLRDRLDSWRDSGATGLWVNFLDLAALLDRLDAAELENERLRSESKAQLEELDRIDDALGTNEGPSAVDHIMILKTENEQLREDAERYRWLRGREDGRYMTVYAFRTDVDEVCLGEELDVAIDAARAAEQSDERSEK